MNLKSILCTVFGHDWRYNFPSLPSKAICTKCKRRERWIIGTIPGKWAEGFEDARSNKELIEKWCK